MASLWVSYPETKLPFLHFSQKPVFSYRIYYDLKHIRWVYVKFYIELTF